MIILGAADKKPEGGKEPPTGGWVKDLATKKILEIRILLSKRAICRSCYKFNHIQAGEGAQCAPLQVFPCCAKKVSSRLMKLSDFLYNYIGHHLK